MKFSLKYHEELWGRIAKMEKETQKLKKQINQITGGKNEKNLSTFSSKEN